MTLTKVTKVILKLTCHTIVREEAATAYTKYLPMRKTFITAFYDNSRQKNPKADTDVSSEHLARASCGSRWSMRSPEQEWQSLRAPKSERGPNSQKARMASSTKMRVRVGSLGKTAPIQVL